MSLEDNWWEVRMRTSDNRWTYLAGPGDEEWAHSLVDSLVMPGRQVAVVRVGIWSKVTL